MSVYAGDGLFDPSTAVGGLGAPKGGKKVRRGLEEKPKGYGELKGSTDCQTVWMVVDDALTNKKNHTRRCSVLRHSESGAMIELMHDSNGYMRFTTHGKGEVQGCSVKGEVYAVTGGIRSKWAVEVLSVGEIVTPNNKRMGNFLSFNNPLTKDYAALDSDSSKFDNSGMRVGFDKMPSGGRLWMGDTVKKRFGHVDSKWAGQWHVEVGVPTCKITNNSEDIVIHLTSDGFTVIGCGEGMKGVIVREGTQSAVSVGVEEARRMVIGLPCVPDEKTELDVMREAREQKDYVITRGEVLKRSKQGTKRDLMMEMQSSPPSSPSTSPPTVS
eukprot:CAMPEP_0114112324 /NCGR_PEP_ID=MMETSP0043_2-20121206/2328_1 /TAXON_ID=464988 /ORGANISM="Hemiselmis andersenii, Strain CCMP644" /LENGTH=326 /DNA_ID=CAMNT_0001204419 /DNA_START=18 /DNA_END=994 /DNA_ORIENTATION=+